MQCCIKQYALILAILNGKLEKIIRGSMGNASKICARTIEKN